MRNILTLAKPNYNEDYEFKDLFTNERIEKNCDICKINNFQKTRTFVKLSDLTKHIILAIPPYDYNQQTTDYNELQILTSLKNFDCNLIRIFNIKNYNNEVLSFYVKAVILFNRELVHYSILRRKKENDNWYYIDSLNPNDINISQFPNDLLNVYCILLEKLD